MNVRSAFDLQSTEMPPDADNVSELHPSGTHYCDIISMLDANDIDRLRGFMTDNQGLIETACLRTRTWPLLIGCDYIKEKDCGTEDVELCRQVDKDVDRSFIYVAETPENMRLLKKRLRNVILRIFREIPELNYYQGYHDIASLVVLTFDNDDEAFTFLYTLTLRYLRDHMLSNIEPTLNQLNLILEVLHNQDEEMYCILKSLKPIYALSCIITLFTHDITNWKDVSLFWDLILAKNDPQLIIYVYVALIIYYKDDILMDLNELSDSSLSSKGTDFGFDDDIIHYVMSNFIKTHLNEKSIDAQLEVFNIFQLALRIQEKVPLNRLKSFRNISKFSCLKANSTSKTILHLQIHDHKRCAVNLLKKKQLQQLSESSIIKHKISNIPVLFKLSFGVALMGVLLHSTKPSIISTIWEKIGR